MQTKQKTLAIAGAGIAAAAALGITGATLATAAAETSASSVVSGYGQQPGGGAPGTDQRRGGMRDAGGTLTADAANRAVAAVALDGGTVTGVRALSDGTYLVDATTSNGAHVHVLLDKAFAVTSTEQGGMGRGGRGMPDADGDAPEGGTGSTDPNDANGTSTTSLPAT